MIASRVVTVLVRSAHPLDAYLAPTAVIDSDADTLGAWVASRLAGLDPIAAAEAVFLFVRDEVHHAWDVRSERVTCAASEVLLHREGLCYAKSHLAAALLRRAGIPSGLCYQRLTLDDDDPSRGYVLHGFNTVWLAPLARWIRFDARGNRSGIDARFSLGEERLAYTARAALGEEDDGVNHPDAHPRVLEALRAHRDLRTLMAQGLPSRLD